MNRLGREQSPYLLQHANNPVEWFPWGDEAFAKARDDDKPIFLSIDYSTCHWCHVMEHESFERPEIAAVLNEHCLSSTGDDACGAATGISNSELGSLRQFPGMTRN